MHEILEWLYQNATQQKSGREWAALLHVRILDPDGWRGNEAPTLDMPIGLEEFVARLACSTTYEYDPNEVVDKS